MSPLIPWTANHLLLATAETAPAAPVATPTALEPIMGVVVSVGICVLVLGIVLCLVRVLRGPHLADRVMAGDTLALHVVGLVAVLAIQQRTSIFLDVALVVTILGFVSTLAFAQYIGARAEGEEPS